MKIVEVFTDAPILTLHFDMFTDMRTSILMQPKCPCSFDLV